MKIAGQNFSVTQDAVPAAAPAPAPVPHRTRSDPPETSTARSGAGSAATHRTQVQFEGTVSGLSGRCPDVSFMAGGRQVVANRNTDYKHGKCTDLSNGDRPAITGTIIGNTVTATDIDLKGSKGD